MVSRHATLVIIEYGGSWPRWLSPDHGDMAVVAQHYEGAPGSLVTQVAMRLTALSAMGWRFETVVLVCNNRSDPASASARSVLARGLLARLMGSYSARLVLSSDEYADRRLVHALMSLAAALDGSAHAGIELCVRIGGGEPIRSENAPREALANAS
jgi:hypothetical protein